MGVLSWGPGPPYVAAVSLYVFLLLILAGYTASEKNKHYHMQSLCKNHFLQQLYRKIDGAVLQSQNERNLDCVITFQTHSILQRFQLRFDLLQLDCNDHLFIYDSAHAVGNYKSDLSCRNTVQSVGNMFTSSNFVTLKYVTDGWGTDRNGFKLIITAFKDKTDVFAENVCEHFRCSNEICIDNDLVCDEVDHCGDFSDEMSSAVCTPNELGTVFGMSSLVFVVVVVSMSLVIGGIIVAVAICACRNTSGRPLQTAQMPSQNTSLPLQQTFGSNGSGIPLKPAPPPYPGATCVYPPGNLLRPVGL